MPEKKMNWGTLVMGIVIGAVLMWIIGAYTKPVSGGIGPEVNPQASLQGQCEQQAEGLFQQCNASASGRDCVAERQAFTDKCSGGELPPCGSVGGQCVTDSYCQFAPGSCSQKGSFCCIR